jgi:putative hemolysin
MKRFVLLCACSLLTGCVHPDIEEQNAPAAGRSVSYPYVNLQEYRDAAAKADDYCAQRYGADAQPTGDYNASGGEAVFVCAKNNPQLLTPTYAPAATGPDPVG